MRSPDPEFYESSMVYIPSIVFGILVLFCMILIAVAYQKALGEKNMENSTETRLRDYTRKYTEQSQFQARLLSDLSRDKWYVFLFPTFERTLSDVRENALRRSRERSIDIFEHTERICART